MFRSLRTSLQTQPKATRSGAEGSKGLGGRDGVTLHFLQCCFVPLRHVPAFLPFCLQFSFVGRGYFACTTGKVKLGTNCLQWKH